MHAPSGDGIPTRDALSSVQTPSDWYTHALIQGIQFMTPPVSDRVGNSMPAAGKFYDGPTQSRGRLYVKSAQSRGVFFAKYAGLRTPRFLTAG